MTEPRRWKGTTVEQRLNGSDQEANGITRTLNTLLADHQEVQSMNTAKSQGITKVLKAVRKRVEVD